MDIPTIPFGLLTDEQQQALQSARDAGLWVERYRDPGGWGRIGQQRRFFKDFTYRIALPPLTKPSIDWSHVAPKWRWLATDEDGCTLLYLSKPDLNSNQWWHDSGEFQEAKAFDSFRPGTCDWRESLVERPADD